MSWWDPSGLTNFATQALKTAQKKIDKVLDIKEEEEGNGSATRITHTSNSSSSLSLPKTTAESTPTKTSANEDSFFNSWLTSPSLKSGRSTTSYENSPIDPLEHSISSASASELCTPKNVSEVKTFSHSVTSKSLGRKLGARVDAAGGTSQKYKRSADSRSSDEQQLVCSRSSDEQQSAWMGSSSAILEPVSIVISEKKDMTDDVDMVGLLMETSHKSDGDDLNLKAVDSNSEDTDRIVVTEKTSEHSPELVAVSYADSVGHSSAEIITVDSVPSSKTDISSSYDISQSHLTPVRITDPVTDEHSSNLASGDTDIGTMKNAETLESCSGWNDADTSQIIDDASAADLSSEGTNELIMTDCSKQDVHFEPSDTENIPLAEHSGLTSEERETEDAVSETSNVDQASEKEMVDANHSMSLEADLPPIRQIPSLEGSLETSADELSEGNKTVVADDSDVNYDDNELDESRLDNSQTQQSDGLDRTVSSDGVASAKDGGSVDGDANADSPVQASPEGTQDAGEQSPRSTASNGSYVKNMLEEAMAENSNSAGSSDPVRTESAANSGHTSADEIDTTTSSDIEIISHTSATGSVATSHGSRAFDLSPSRHYSAWSSRSHMSGEHHRRTDSGSSAQSLQSRTEEDFASPDGGVAGHRFTAEPDGHGGYHYRPSREPCRFSGKNESDAQNVVTIDVDKLLKVDNRELAKKLSEMSEVIEAREKKLLELSHENMDLLESNNDLRSRLHHFEQSSHADSEERKALREEYGRKIADMEKRLQQAFRERDGLKGSLHEMEIELARRSENIVSEKLLKDKDQIISELMEEGEKLSKKQLQNSNSIKKLRAKEKENEGLISSQKQKIEEQKAEIERLEHILDVKVDSEKKNVDTINQLNLLVKGQEEEVNRLKSELEDVQEKYRSSKATLDNAYREISDLHKARVTHVSEAQKAALDLEIAAKEQLKMALDEFRQQAKHEKIALVTQLEDLQLSMSRMEKEHGRREDILRQEISDVHQRLQEAEERNQELTQSVSGVTRPLLRQIENLQTTFATQTASYERIEKNLTDRLTEAQSQLAAATENERFASEKLMEANVRLASLESQISSLRQERSRLLAELEVERTKVELAEEAKSNESAQRDATRQKLELELSELKKEKVLMENQLEMEKMKVETGKKKVALLHDQLHEKELLLQMRSSVAPSPTFSKDESIKSDIPVTPLSAGSVHGELSDKMLFMTSVNGSRMSLYDSLRQSGSASSLLESLQSELKQREGEIQQLQSEIAELERTRESMARELVNLCVQNEDLTEKLNQHMASQQNYTELDQRYNALLQMYGEKVEEAQELRLDLQDVKDMYKTQIDELLKSKSNSLRNL